ncbi:DNA polymerase IV [Thermoflexibacter ruber]|uniref:DNA polymerase IV n=1 Tax=Thermoflexibacter ruber TaxID=1003 RepID=A0A1I2EVL7_9BACT|nr:DNA polymerase IV [Thermoflexibacter ruber]SFE96381.1 DNA polymerase-4 [Thermoflexibacter ruber]
MLRKIIHIDMDAFFASVEQRDFPQYRGKPLAVGGAGERGVVAAASYEARRYGVKSAMSSKIALRKCPHLIFAKPRFDVYASVSKQIRAIFYEYTDLVEPLSLDEAYLDITDNKFNNPSATLIAKEIKEKIKAQTFLTASAGVSYNKFLAKVASDMQKPDGLTVITPDKAEKFLEELPIEKFYGIGKVTAEKMQKMGIYKGADLKKIEKNVLLKQFGKYGGMYYDIVRGIDERQVSPDRTRKSLGIEHTFHKDLDNLREMFEALSELADLFVDRLRKSNVYGRTLTLKIKFADFEQITRSRTVSHKLTNREIIYRLAEELLIHAITDQEVSIRLLGLSVSNLDEPEISKNGQLAFTF